MHRHQNPAIIPADIAWTKAVARTRPGPPTVPVRRRSRRDGFLRSFATIVFTMVGLVLAAVPAAGQATPAEDLGVTVYATGITTVSTGGGHSCAVTRDHQVACWGQNGSGQSGTGEAGDPVNWSVVQNRTGTGPLIGVTAVVTGLSHSCALVAGGQVRCWGANLVGQLGDGTTEDRPRPVPVRAATGTGPLRGVVQLSTTESTTCAVLTNGQARCWGLNEDAQIGDGTFGQIQTRPTVVRAVSGTGPLTGVTQIDAGGVQTCARLTNGQARCWGDNTYGQLGDGTIEDRVRPVVVRNGAGTGPLAAIRHISVGGYHACATRTDGTARCWGANAAGQLGDGTSTPHTLPAPVVADATGATPLRGIASVEAGLLHNCARLTDRQVRCWGEDEHGELGNGILPGMDLSIPVPVRNRAGTGNLVGVTQLDSSVLHTCVRLANGQARCWGYNGTGQLGNGNTNPQALPQAVVIPVN